jgi:hypothetical protein
MNGSAVSRTEIVDDPFLASRNEPATLVSLLAVGAERSKLLRSGSEAAMVPEEGVCSVISGGGCCPNGGSWSRAGSLDLDQGSLKLVLLSAEFCHLVGELLDPLQECGAVGGRTNAR